MKIKTGSITATRKTLFNPADGHLLRGPAIGRYEGRPSLLLLNANPFSYGIANLGMQCIAQYLLNREINVALSFADTLGRWAFGADNEQLSAPDVVGLSIPFEDTYLNALRMLDRLGLPIHAQARDDDAPLVVAGGLAMINPIPLGEFMDAIVIGEGREALHQIVERYADVRRRGLSKREALMHLADIPGVYVPSHYRVEVNDRGYVSSFECLNGHPVVEANIPLDLTDHPIHSLWTSPYACYEQEDYVSIMAAMGCHNKCPFCVVGHVQGARSGRAITADVQTILDIALERREAYGVNLVKIFFSSAFSPHKTPANSEHLKALLAEMHRHGFSCRVGSLNVKQADPELFELLRAVGQDEVTFAPETTESLRPRLGKGYISDDKLRELAHHVGRYGLSLNIYSLGAIPGETDDDTQAFAALLRALRRILGQNSRLIVHYNPVFMKAQTPFQYFGCTRPAEIRRKYRLLRAQLQGHEIEFVSVIPSAMTYYQPVLALGDANSAKVLARLYHKRQCSEEDWIKAFTALGLDDSRYFTAKDPSMTLPWEHIAYTDHQRLKRLARGLQRSVRLH